MFKKVAIVLAIVLVAGGIFTFPKIMLYLASRAESTNSNKVEFFVDKAIDLKELADKLKTAGVIEDLEGFIKVGEYKELNKENIAMGKYVIEPNTQYRTILNGFKMNAAGNGNGEVEVDVMFNNCRFMSDMAGKVSSLLLMDSTELLSYLDSPETYAKFGFTKEQFPAMFLPNTYKMYYDTDPEQFTKRMAEEFKDFWNADRTSKLKAVGLKSPSQAVTLASIVFSEQSNVADEWPVIAGLYLNRIEQGIKLQSDPTFKFCWGKQLDGVQRLLFIHRDIDCAYNTYKIDGLPPGPICIPPAATIDAVLNRTKHNYIFMMAKPDFSGRHDFSVDYATHQRLATVYQKWLSTLN
jgi:UPF0755 protein